MAGDRLRPPLAAKKSEDGGLKGRQEHFLCRGCPEQGWITSLSSWPDQMAEHAPFFAGDGHGTGDRLRPVVTGKAKVEGRRDDRSIFPVYGCREQGDIASLSSWPDQEWLSTPPSSPGDGHGQGERRRPRHQGEGRVRIFRMQGICSMPENMDTDCDTE